MLEFAAEKKIKSWVQTRPMAEANQALLDVQAGKPRYRQVLVNE
jgi:alcohol dehydrogenase (NADP+)